MGPALAALAGDAAREAIKTVVKLTAERHVGKEKDDTERRRAVERQVARVLNGADGGALGLEVQEAFRWASEIHVQGMGRPVYTDAASVPLQLTAVPRRFRAGEGLVAAISERDLVTSNDSFLILGDPGSGKTTTLKRLTLSLFEETMLSSGNAELSLPVVLVCRLIDWTVADLASEIISRVGLDPVRVRQTLDLNEARSLQFAAEVLDRAACLLIVDGLDEVADLAVRGSLIGTLGRLRRLTNSARIICSCRSGDAPHLEGYAVAELLPLSQEQIASIASARTGLADSFLTRVSEAGIDQDLLDRPLFLNQLLTVFETTGNLPERPVDLYRQLLRLLLHEWDEQRGVKRRTRYGDFDSETKKEFLSEIAFRLTLHGRATFGEDHLVQIYDDIREQFGLPRRQALQVVREIESHIGIIVEIPNGFQFSHFTMQEYLCADNILRRPIDDQVSEYLRRFPAVIAVTVALSSNPTRWLVECLKRSRSFKPPQLASTFISRLGLERPRFSADVELGITLVSLMAQTKGSDAPSWQRISEIDAARDSIALTRDRFIYENRGESVTVVRRRSSDDGPQRRPAFKTVPAAIFDLFQDSSLDTPAD